MTTRTMYHVTDAANVYSILSEGLRAGPHDKVFLVETPEDAAALGDAYHTIEDPVVLEVEALQHKIEDDHEPTGDIDSYFVRASVPAARVEVYEQ